MSAVVDGAGLPFLPVGIRTAAGYAAAMNPLGWLGLTVLLVVGVVLTGLGPKGGKPVARTGLMKVARFVLIAGMILCGALGVFSALRP
jgi:hypothetical protein